MSDSGFGDTYRYLSPDLSAGKEGEDQEWVPVTTLDLFSRDHKIASAAFLKIDVDGGNTWRFKARRNSCE